MEPLEEALAAARSNYDDLLQRCERLNEELASARTEVAGLQLAIRRTGIGEPAESPAPEPVRVDTEPDVNRSEVTTGDYSMPAHLQDLRTDTRSTAILKVLTLLGEPVPTTDLVNFLRDRAGRDESPGSVGAALSKLAKDGQVRRVDRGLYEMIRS